MVAVKTWGHWTAEEDWRLRNGREHGLTYQTMAIALGRTKSAVTERARTLGLAGKKVPDWTRADEERLVTLLEAHQSYDRIARTLKRSRNAVIDRCVRLGISLTTANGQSMNEVAGVLGIDSHAVGWWAREGWLKAHGVGSWMGHGELRIVEWDDLAAFLENEEFWDLWEPERITDQGLRAWTAELRKGIRFLTTAEAGDALGLTEGGVNLAVRQGRIKGVKHGPNWKIRNDWLILPERRAPKARKSLNPEEVVYLIEHWGSRPGTVIAADLGVSRSYIGLWAVKLGLPQFGRGHWRKVRAGTGIR